jgi:hypothetical protein
MYEVLFEIRPYDNENIDFNLFELGFKVMNGYRPIIPDIIFTESEKKYIELMKRCWDQNPLHRPSCQEIYIEIENNVIGSLLA